jgi:hypothetical protein
VSCGVGSWPLPTRAKRLPLSRRDRSVGLERTHHVGIEGERGRAGSAGAQLLPITAVQVRYDREMSAVADEDRQSRARGIAGVADLDGLWRRHDVHRHRAEIEKQRRDDQCAASQRADGGGSAGAASCTTAVDASGGPAGTDRGRSAGTARSDRASWRGLTAGAGDRRRRRRAAGPDGCSCATRAAASVGLSTASDRVGTVAVQPREAHIWSCHRIVAAGVGILGKGVVRRDRAISEEAVECGRRIGAGVANRNDQQDLDGRGLAARHTTRAGTLCNEASVVAKRASRHGQAARTTADFQGGADGQLDAAACRRVERRRVGLRAKSDVDRDGGDGPVNRALELEEHIAGALLLATHCHCGKPQPHPPGSTAAHLEHPLCSKIGIGRRCALAR